MAARLVIQLAPVKGSCGHSRLADRDFRGMVSTAFLRGVVFTWLVLIAIPGAANPNQSDFRFVCSEDIQEELESDSLRLVTLNASHGRNTAINQIFVGKKRTYRNLDRLAELLDETRADVVALQEADAPSRWSGRIDHVQYVSERADYPCILHGLHSQSVMSTYGTALISRIQSYAPASITFEPSPPSKLKGYVSAQILWRTRGVARRVTLVSVHFDFLSSKARDSQVAEVVAVLSELDGPLIVLGDLNSEWDSRRSHVQQLASGLGLKAFDPRNPALGTFKKLDGKRLDWILISRELEFERYEVLPTVVADHFAVLADVVLSE